MYDALLLPALNYAERDRLEQRLSPEEETAVIDATRELLVDAAAAIRRLRPRSRRTRQSAIAAAASRPPRAALGVLGYATNGVADELALAMLAHLVDDLPIAVEISRTRMLASDVVSLIEEKKFSVVCFADLPPSPPSKTRYLVKRLRAALPDVRILVGRWAPPALADESTQVLRDAGAKLVASTLMETPRLSRHTRRCRTGAGHRRRLTTPPTSLCFAHARAIPLDLCAVAGRPLSSTRLQFPVTAAECDSRLVTGDW